MRKLTHVKDIFESLVENEQ